MTLLDGSVRAARSRSRDSEHSIRVSSTLKCGEEHPSAVSNWGQTAESRTSIFLIHNGTMWPNFSCPSTRNVDRTAALTGQFRSPFSGKYVLVKTSHLMGTLTPCLSLREVPGGVLHLLQAVARSAAFINCKRQLLNRLFGIQNRNL